MLPTNSISKQLLLIIPLLYIFSSSCKKQTYEPAGKTESSGIIDPNEPVMEYWNSASLPYNNVVNLKSANGYLYFSTQSSNGAVSLRRLNPDNTVSTIFTSSNGSDVINDLEFYNGRLYFGGRISYESGYNLGYIEGNSLTPINVPLNQNSYTTNSVISLHYFEPDNMLYFTGKFSPTGNVSDYVTTLNLERINTNFEAGGAITNGLSQWPGYLAGNSDLYQYGSTIITNLPFQSKIGKMNATNWTSFEGFNSVTDIKVVSLYDQNDTTYLSYCTTFWWNNAQVYTNYKTKMIVNNVEYPLQDLGGYEPIINFKKVNNELFAFGSAITLNGKFTNIFRLVNGHWKADKIIKYPIKDIEYYNGYYYAVTTSGAIYKTSW